MTSQTLTPEEFRRLALAIHHEVAKVIVGQKELVRLLLVNLMAGGHCLLEGAPGLGKTVLVRTLAQVIRCSFSRIQFTPDLMPADIVGTLVVSEEDGRRSFRFEPGPIFAQLILADEINRATPKTQSALLEAMQEQTVTVAKTTHRLDRPFFVLATQNPLEMEGTFPLPESQLDRFLFKLDVPFPERADLVEIANRTTGDRRPSPAAVTDAQSVLDMQELARQVPIAQHVTEYGARLVEATHPAQPGAPGPVKEYVRYGASPRGLQALVLSAKILALLDGRYNVAFQDLDAVALPALRHRIILNYHAQAEGVTPDDILHEVLQRTTQRA